MYREHKVLKFYLVVGTNVDEMGWDGIETDVRLGVSSDVVYRLGNPNHKLHHLLPDVRNVSYLLRSRTEYPLVRARTNRYMNSLIPWCLRNCQ